MNYIALRLVEFLLTGPMTKTGSGGMPTSNGILESARIPLVFARPLTLHWGFFLSIVIAILAWFLLFKTKWGFNLQIAGANKHAAKYAVLNVKVWMVLGMTLHHPAVGHRAGAPPRARSCMTDPDHPRYALGSVCQST